MDVVETNKETDGYSTSGDTLDQAKLSVRERHLDPEKKFATKLRRSVAEAVYIQQMIVVAPFWRTERCIALFCAFTGR